MPSCLDFMTVRRMTLVKCKEMSHLYECLETQPIPIFGWKNLCLMHLLIMWNATIGHHRFSFKNSRQIYLLATGFSEPEKWCIQRKTGSSRLAAATKAALTRFRVSWYRWFFKMVVETTFLEPLQEIPRESHLGLC